MLRPVLTSRVPVAAAPQALLVLATALVAGCAVQPARAPAPVAIPAAYSSAGVQGGAWPAQDWYRSFGSEELDSFVEQAVRNNWDIAAARARILQADARARQAGAAILPAVDGVGNASFLSGHSGQGSGHETDWSAMVSASYEVDFWGKNRATATAASLQADSARVERDTVALTVLGGVADQYFQVLALRERLTLARSNHEAATKILEAVQARFEAGVGSPVEVAAQRAAVHAAQIAVSDLQLQESQARAALALLLGRAPEEFTVSGQSLDPLREPAVAPGLPSALLTRRPDIFMAEANLRASSASVAAARAAMFPSLSLTAGAGLQNPALPATVLTIPGVGPSFALTASLVQPIFNHGRLQAQRDEAVGREQELLAAYRGAIVASLVDVEKALSAIDQLRAAADAQQGSVSESERAFEGAQLRYHEGAGDFLTLLEAQRTLYAARDQYTQYRLARLQALIGLCKALGGGWDAAAARS
ncbi:MAG: TolC family protein [Proteobacteria bacterium]|nr:TolC family protein [Pseudomonadota bacterium]